MLKTNITQKEETLLKKEILRKSIHIFSLLIPVIYIFVDQVLALSILGPMMLVSLLIEVLNYKHEPTRRIFMRIFGVILRPHEIQRRFTLNGATCVLISAFFTVLIFPKIVMVTAFTILIISDMSAALIGRRFGQTPFLNKSLEGSLAFALTAMMTVVAYGLIFAAPWTYFLFGLIAAVIGAIVEGASENFKIDDNFSIPFSVSLFLWLTGFLADFLGFPYLHIL